MPDYKVLSLQKKLAEIHRAGEEREAERRAERSGYPYLDLRTAPISVEAVQLISEDDAKTGELIGLQLKVKELAVAIVDPEKSTAKKVIQGLVKQGYNVKLFIVSLSALTQALHMYQLTAGEAKEITGKVDIEKQRLAELSERLTTLKSVNEEIGRFDPKDLTTTILFEIILAGALANRTSDIHLEAEEKRARIRFRIDGALYDVYPALPLKNYTALISRIKLLSGLKINVRGEAQDGRFTIGLTNKEIEMRVSIIPAEFGETIVMRILDPAAINLSLEDLGLRADDLVLAEEALQSPNGLILNTGPTGSGKTTTLYAFLRHVNKSDIKIITIEDPVEYHLEGIEQTQVDSDAGYTFASGLRSILRQDPDVILVGEIRDLETADIAMQAALTGHLVFSTLHTNDAVGAVPRLINLGVKPATIGPALSLIIAQRLVRRLCSECKQPAKIPTALAEKITLFLKNLPARIDKNKYAKYNIFEPVGCVACNNLGYKGRIGIMEFFKAGPELEQVTLKEVSEIALRKLAVVQEMVPMQSDGILKSLDGVTTLAEVEAVTGKIKWS